MSMIAALYIDPRGPYPKLLGPEACWDEARDARLYEGPWPVVAHPPCGPWGKLAFCSKYQPKDCGPRAVEQVRAFGGVLEHPRGSKLWAHCGLPRPGELPDEFGGITIEVDQVRWGHVARKTTWLYLVAVREVGPIPPPREPTHWCSGFRSSRGKYPANYKRTGCAVPPGIKVCSAQQRRRTPVAFAEWLIALARTVEPRT
jgi:hypothetical protein